MPIILTEEETRIKGGLKREGDKPESGCPLDRYKTRFHHTMQNPVAGIISFDGWSRSLLNNGLLCRLTDYFTASGEFLFETKINSLIIKNICLKGYNRGLHDQMPDGTTYIGQLISKNPDIEEIDLSNTSLGDYEAKILLKHLEKNTKLFKLNLSGNPISQDLLDAIQLKLTENYNNSEKNKSLLQIRRAARYIDQGSRSVESPFSTLPPEINAYIASFFAKSCHTSEEAEKIAGDHLCRPTITP